MSTLTSLNTIISSNKVPSLEVDSSNYQQIKLKNTTKSVENALPQTRCAVFLSLFFVDHRRLLTVYCPQNRLTDKTNVKILHRLKIFFQNAPKCVLFLHAHVLMTFLFVTYNKNLQNASVQSKFYVCVSVFFRKSLLNAAECKQKRIFSLLRAKSTL